MAYPAGPYPDTGCSSYSCENDDYLTSTYSADGKCKCWSCLPGYRAVRNKDNELKCVSILGGRIKDPITYDALAPTPPSPSSNSSLFVILGLAVVSYFVLFE